METNTLLFLALVPLVPHGSTGGGNGGWRGGGYPLILARLLAQNKKKMFSFCLQS